MVIVSKYCTAPRATLSNASATPAAHFAFFAARPLSDVRCRGRGRQRQKGKQLALDVDIRIGLRTVDPAIQTIARVLPCKDGAWKWDWRRRCDDICLPLRHGALSRAEARDPAPWHSTPADIAA